MGRNRKAKSRKTDRAGSAKLLSQGTRELLAEKVRELALPLCEDENVELVHVEFVIDGYLNVLRIYIDKPDGVTMDDCTEISRQLGDILDVSVTIDAEYRLEVSSPGIYRQLYNKDDYERFSGRTVKIQLDTPVEGQWKIAGILNGISDQDIVEVSVDGSIVELNYASIIKARLTEDNGDSRC